MKRKLRKRVLVLPAVLLAAGILWYILANRPNEGRTYIQAQAQKDPATLQSTLLEKRKSEVQAEMAAGTLDTSALISDYCIIGDSRAEALANAGLSSTDRSFTTIGTTVMDVDNHIEEVENLKPGNIILIYGLNDVSSNLNGLEGGYGKLYESYVNKLLEADPGAHIFVSPILPVSTEALAANPQYENIPAYNEELKEMCARNGWTLIDYDTLDITDDIYDADGEHFLWTWLPIWYTAIAENVWQVQG